MTGVRPTYAGIGSRETPRDVLSVMWRIARRLEALGWLLHSGGADGADTAFELGVRDRSENARVFLPWRGFNDATRLRLGLPEGRVVVHERMYEVAQRFHPAWRRLSSGGQLLMARNGFQVLGPTLDRPVRCVVCWTKDGGPTGGTGQALRIAAAYDVPSFNLYNQGSLGDFTAFVQSTG